MVKKILGFTGISVALVVGMSQTDEILGSSADDMAKITVEYVTGETIEYSTYAETLGEFVEEVDFELEGTETFEIDMDEAITDGMILEVDPGVELDVYVNGEKSTLKVKTGSTVDDLTERLTEETGLDYYCTDDNTDPFNESRSVELLTRGITTEVTTEPVAFEIVYEESTDLPLGEEKVITQGIDGSKEITEEVVTYAGEEFIRKEISSEIVTEPVAQIVQIGVNPTVNTSEGAREYSTVYSMNASAYTAGYESTGKSPGDYGYGITATGTVAEHGVVAVDPNVIPLGTELYIPGYGIAVAADTGGAIKGHKIDLFYEDLNSALSFGRRTVQVYVLE